MINVKQFSLIILFFCSFGLTFGQAADSLNVFPNPFSNSATIHFEIDQSEIITLKVYNTAGQTVKTFFESTVLASGSYNINLLGDSLVNGVYIINLKIGSTKNLTVKVVKNSSTTGISDQHVDQNRLIYPNPTTDEITIDIKGEKTIILTDLNGKIVKSLTTAQKVISVLDLTAGSYFLTVFNKKNEVLVSKKIIKTE